jgi:hypothetical protein
LIGAPAGQTAIMGEWLFNPQLILQYFKDKS